MNDSEIAKNCNHVIGGGKVVNSREINSRMQINESNQREVLLKKKYKGRKRLYGKGWMDQLWRKRYN